MNLLNIRRVAFGLKELSDVRRETGQPAAPGACAEKPAVPAASAVTREQIEAITRAVLARLGQ